VILNGSSSRIVWPSSFRDRPATPALRWQGVSDSPDPSAFLDAVIRRAVRELKGCAMAVDFRKLEYMNSATVSPLINLVKALDVGSLGVLVLFSDADWQRTHFQCMKTIPRTLKHVQVERKPAS
jgi:hypothetical protein